MMDLRESFIDFFRERGHTIVPSSPLLPKNDPTLLFTTAGMVQFKPMFAGTVPLDYNRAASVQKCLRTSDLENVGKTKRHLTFFEMLGNFSFGDYFKEDAIKFAWDYSTNTIKFPKEKIWVSIYEDDDEAFRIWNERIGVAGDKITRLGKKDNFWGPAGDSGACGPCSELYIDRGEKYGCGKPDCRPGCDCERFLEYWNLVFNQFYQDATGKLAPLPKTGIDTGMGLERLATLVQNVDSVFETDELGGLVKFVSGESGKKYDGENRVPINIIVEHSRALIFAMSDGIYPSNDGRGYVLRRILRRALRYCRQLGIEKPFIYRVVDPIVSLMGGYYPEIKTSAKNVRSVIEAEEKRFLETIGNGMNRLDELMRSLKEKGGKSISGADAFVLYDTFGFPVEMTVEIASENGLVVDVGSYEKEMESQRERGKQSWKGAADMEKAYEELAKGAGDTAFTGYESERAESAIVTMHNGSRVTDVLDEGESGLIVLKETCFYGEAGGQAGDRGFLISGSGSRFAVEDTKKINRTIIHSGKVLNGVFKKGDSIKAEIDPVHRNLIRANHTATHLLQAALRSVLGTHVKQSGSQVSSERLRFDFSHFNSMRPDEIERVESIVNAKIWENITVDTEIMDLKKAVSSGAMAVFDEKYEDRVRVVKVDDFSRELCGGTHVGSTGEIGVFKIIKESSPGAGLRRIEAVTLKGIIDRYNSHDRIIEQLTGILNVSENMLVKRADDLTNQVRSLEKEMEKIKRDRTETGIDEILKDSLDVNGIKIVKMKFTGTGTDDLRSISDSVRSKEQASVVIFGSDADGKALLLFAATGKAVGAGVDCGKLIKNVSGIVGGGGGGRKDMAQAGGKDPSKLEEALGEAVKLARGMIGG